MPSEEDIKKVEKFIRAFKTDDTKSVCGFDVQAIENILQDYKELKEKDEARTSTVNKVIMEYIPDYELTSLVNRYKNESFIPRVEVEKILQDRKK